MTKTRRVDRKIWRYRRRAYGHLETFKEYLAVSERNRQEWMAHFKRYKPKKVCKDFNPATFTRYPETLFRRGHLNKSKQQIKRDGKLTNRKVVKPAPLKMFPIQEERINPPNGLGPALLIDFPREIPWKDAERAYKTYSKRYGTSQSLERLAERAGFGPSEFVMLYYGLPDEHKTWSQIEYYRTRYKDERR